MMRMKRTTPPVSVRKNSLKTNSLTDEMVISGAKQQQQQQFQQQQQRQQPNLPQPNFASKQFLQNHNQQQLPLQLQQSHLVQMGVAFERTELNNFNNQNATGRNHDTKLISNGTQFNNINNNNNNQKPMDINNQPSCSATLGKDEDFPPPPSPLPCITESYGIKT